MNEHTSHEISKQLYEKGFKRAHASWHAVPNDEHGMQQVISDAQKSWMDFRNNYNISVPAYTFTELWAHMDATARGSFLVHLTYRADRNDLANVAGEWLIDNGHIDLPVKEAP